MSIWFYHFVKSSDFTPNMCARFGIVHSPKGSVLTCLRIPLDRSQEEGKYFSF